MILRKSVLVAIALVIPSLCAYSERYVEKHRVSDRVLAVVAEAELEPRSIGSYTVRIYEILNRSFPPTTLSAVSWGNGTGRWNRYFCTIWMTEPARRSLSPSGMWAPAASFLSMHTVTGTGAWKKSPNTTAFPKTPILWRY